MQSNGGFEWNAGRISVYCKVANTRFVPAGQPERARRFNAATESNDQRELL
jgi:hypothetical protein